MEKRRRSAWQQTRKFFNDVHLWAGLISGLIIIAVCFSGTVYTYNTELTEYASRHLYRVDVPENGQRHQVDELLASVAQQAGGAVTSVRIPGDTSKTLQFSVRREGEQSRSGVTYFVNPYTGELHGTSDEQRDTRTAVFMRDMFSLHRWLLLDRIEKPLIGELPNRTLGSYITGAATILFTLGVLTGLVIWFPNKLRTWKQGLRIKWRAGWKRLNHDLHNTLACYSLVFLFLMGITGPQWSFPWYREGLQRSLGTYQEAPAERGNARGSRPESRTSKEPAVLLPVEKYLAAADAALPYPGDYTVNLPTEHGKPVVIRKNETGFFASAAANEVKLDATTAAVEDVMIFADKPLNERIAGSIKALHIGNVYGQFTKLLYFFACLIATSLPITGTLIWWNKLKKKPGRRRVLRG